MPGRMMIRGSVTAQRDATRLACAQVNPTSSDLHALCAFLSLGSLDGFDTVDMLAILISHDKSSEEDRHKVHKRHKLIISLYCAFCASLWLLKYRSIVGVVSNPVSFSRRVIAASFF